MVARLLSVMHMKPGQSGELWSLGLAHDTGISIHPVGLNDLFCINNVCQVIACIVVSTFPILSVELHGLMQVQGARGLKEEAKWAAPWSPLPHPYHSLPGASREAPLNLFYILKFKLRFYLEKKTL